ncbi:MAG: hypothetical protein SF051_05335 [Elusimicrobiota bacterium]|nr:hypothetical protein [Elusimicrobiota bacterium]
MGFQIKKISNHGTSNPIVARLTIQTDELLGFCTIPKEKKEEILILYHDEIMPRLLACDTIAQRIAKDVLEVEASLEKTGLVRQAGGRVVEVPQVMDLQQDAEQFLYTAKCVLREAAKVFKPFFEQEFKKARYDQIIVWAKERFGESHEIPRMLKEDHDLWLSRLIDMRNAVEHPDKLRLTIKNFELGGDKLAVPMWQLNDTPATDLAQDMLFYVESMLTFCEDLLMAGIHTAGIFPGVGFGLIPEAERKVDCPKRIRMALLKDLNFPAPPSSSPAAPAV